MNPDIILSPRFFIEIFAPFYKDHTGNIGMVEGRQTPIEHPKDYNSKTGDTEFATTAACVVPYKLFSKLNGFDEMFFMYCDDVDFSFKARKNGKRVIYSPSAVVYHAKRLTSEGQWQPTSKAEIYYSAEAALLMAYKWGSSKSLNKLKTIFAKSNDAACIKALNRFEEMLRNKQLSAPEGAPEFDTYLDSGYSKRRYW
jgi:GT2 family glycosyltransferase